MCYEAKGAPDRRQYARAQPYMRSIVGRCTRSHVTAQNSHDARREAMAIRATRDMRLMWHALDRESCARPQCAQSWLCALVCKCARSSLMGSITVCLITHSALKCTGRDQMCILANFHPLNHILTPTTCNTIKQ